jgi:sporulation-control protein
VEKAMPFKKLLASFGAGGASVETVLTDADVMPGGSVDGEVRVRGGSVNQQIQGLTVGLQARIEVEFEAEGEDPEREQDLRFTAVRLGGSFELRAGAEHTVPFTLGVPWETPITVIDGQSLRGMDIGVATGLDIARAVDSSDLDPLRIRPLPAQQAILDAFIRLGFRFKSADIERGHIRGTRQQLPFYQEIEFLAPQQYSGLHEVELSFVADDNAMDVVLEMDKRSGLFRQGGDTIRVFELGHHEHQGTDWAAYLHQWLSETITRHRF